MSAASPVSICSNALLRLGADPISSFEDGTKHAGLCANLWPTVRDALLRSHSWNCAVRRVQLAPMSKTPEFDFQNQFQLPGDWIKTLQVGRKGRYIDYQMEGRRILANVSLLPLVYVWRNEVPSSWDDAMVITAELKMAAALAYPVTASTSLMESLDQKAEIAARDARSDDGQDTPPEELDGYPMYSSRF
jgi:hypothetical protein